VEALIDAAPADIGLVLALARFAGLRIPSEIAGMVWDDVDLENGRLLVRSPKTEHHGLSRRYVPVCSPVLRRLLHAAQERAAMGVHRVFPGVTATSNLREAVERVARRCQVSLWPKLFVNLRSSFETELLERFPAKDVASWLGHTVAIQQKHYAQVRHESFLRAVEEGSRSAEDLRAVARSSEPSGGGAESGAVRGGTGLPWQIRPHRRHRKNPAKLKKSR
jgi:integrase